MASFKIATIYKDHATLRGYEKCGLGAARSGIATLVGIFLIPVCYVFVQGLAEWGRKKPANAATPATELAAH
jgi:hypothetical protein